MTTNFERRWDHLAQDELTALQERRLRRLLRRQLGAFSPFYRRRFREQGIDPRDIRTLEDLRHLPFTTKQDFLPSEEYPAGPRDLILQPTPELIRSELSGLAKAGFAARVLLRGSRRVRAALRKEYGPHTVVFTTGRSTGSVPFFLTLHDHQIMLEVGRRLADVLDVTPERDRIFNLFPYAPHLAFWQVANVGVATGTLTLNTGGGRVMGADRMLGAIDRLAPTLIVGMPGYFYHVLRRAVAEGRDWSSVRAVALGGENVPGGFKRKVLELMAEVGAGDVRVASVLGFTEARQCWTECLGGRRTGFHTYPDLAYFEIIDPDTGERLPDGETGEMVFTPLAGRGSLVLRYRTGDIVEGGITHEPCPGCGRTMPRIMSDIHRVSNVKSLEIGKVKGTLVNFNALSQAFTEHPDVEEWQLELRKRNDDPFETDELILYCAPRGDVDHEDLRQQLQNLVHESAEIHLNRIEMEDIDRVLVRVGMEERTKEERIVDARVRAGATDREAAR